MKLKKTARALCAVMAAAIVAAPISVSAITYKDVPSTHWAYAAVNQVSGAGIIVGDLSGNFEPDSSLDKFDTAKILAVMAGYKYTEISSAEQAYYNQAYADYVSYLNTYSSTYAKWDSTANMEIAYLLAEGVLVPSDLDQFIVMVSGTERLRALSREEAAVFLVRVMGREATALTSSYAATFKDDASISSSSKPYVYYLKSLGVFTGDTANNFNPNGAVTKAAMSVLVQKTLLIVDPYYFTGGSTSNTGSGTSSSVMMSGSVANVYSSFRAVQISSTDTAYNSKIYPVSASANISINGVAADFASLEQGMNFIGVVTGTELTAVAAYTSSNSGSSSSQTSKTDASLPLTLLDGTATALRYDSTGDYVSIQIRMINPRGEITTETREYLVPASCTISRGSVTTNYDSIVVGDLIVAKARGTTCESIALEEKNRSVTGTIVEKKNVSYSSYPAIVVEDSSGNQWDLLINNNTYIYRKGSGEVSVSGLRIGDTVDVKAEYNIAVGLYAYGTSSKIDVFIVDIFISETEQPRITGRTEDGDEETYFVVTGSVDMYELHVGSKVRLRLDSKEVSSLTILQEASGSSVIGYITDFTKTSITVRDAYGDYDKYTYTYDSSTVITNSVAGTTASYSDFATGMKVYISSTSGTSNTAQTITILSY